MASAWSAAAFSVGSWSMETPNFEPANSLKTPEHIAPVWYFTPFYAMLRAVNYPLFGVDAKFWGVVVMGLDIAILFVLPWLDRSAVRSIRYKGWLSRIAIVIFVVSFVTLGVLGVMPPTHERTIIAQLATVAYFAFFILMPLYTRFETTRAVPDRVTGR